MRGGLVTGGLETPPSWFLREFKRTQGTSIKDLLSSPNLVNLVPTFAIQVFKLVKLLKVLLN